MNGALRQSAVDLEAGSKIYSHVKQMIDTVVAPPADSRCTWNRMKVVYIQTSIYSKLIFSNNFSGQIDQNQCIFLRLIRIIF